MAARIPLAYSARWLHQRCKCVTHVLKNGRSQGIPGSDKTSHLGDVGRAILGLALVEVAHSFPGRQGIGKQKYRSEQTTASELSAESELSTKPDEAPSHPEKESSDDTGTSKELSTGRLSSWMARKFGKSPPSSTSSSEHAEDEELLHQVDRLREAEDFETAMKLLNSTKGDTVEHLWRRGHLAYELAKRASNKSEKKQLILSGFESVRRALELDDNSYRAHFWMLPLVHARAEIEGLVATAGVASAMKTDLDALVRIRPHDPEPYFCYGMWHYALAEISWIEKLAAAAIGSALPNCTFEDARDSFQRAEDMAPRTSMLNALWLGKSYYRLHDMEKARYYLEQGVNMTATKTPEIKEREVAIKLLKKIEKSTKST